jgi:hypothetical protein
MTRTGDALGQAAAFGLACAATLVVFTIARGHYYVMLLPANVLVPLWLLRNGQTRWAFGMATVPLLLIFGHYLLLEYTGRIGLLGLGTAAWYFGSSGLLVGSRRLATRQSEVANTAAQSFAVRPPIATRLKYRAPSYRDDLSSQPGCGSRSS